MLATGVILSALAVLVLASLLVVFTKVTDKSGFDSTVTVPGAFFLTQRQSQVVSILIALPGVLLVAALVFLFFGVFQRRAAEFGARDRKWLQGGSIVSLMKPLGTKPHLLWVAVALVFWLLLVIVPVIVSTAGGWPTNLDETQSGYTFLTIGVYGGLAAAVMFVLITSLVKKTSYVAALRKRGDRARGGGPGKGFWRWFTFRWRFDLWLAGVGGALIGTCWIALIFDDTGFFFGALAIGVVLVALGVLTAVQYWRAGQPLGTGESFA